MSVLVWIFGIALLAVASFCIFLIKTNLELENRLLNVEYDKFMSKVDKELQNLGNELSTEDYELVKKNTRMLQ